MAAEVRQILTEATEDFVREGGLGTAIHGLFKPYGGVDLELPPREPAREPPHLD